MKIVLIRDGVGVDYYTTGNTVFTETEDACKYDCTCCLHYLGKSTRNKKAYFICEQKECEAKACGYDARTLSLPTIDNVIGRI